MAVSTANLVPITRAFLSKFYDQHPFEPISGDVKKLQKRLQGLEDELESEWKKHGAGGPFAVLLWMSKLDQVGRKDVDFMNSPFRDPVVNAVLGIFLAQQKCVPGFVSAYSANTWNYIIQNPLLLYHSKTSTLIMVGCPRKQEFHPPRNTLHAHRLAVHAEEV
jgi:hypothetical protein